MPRLVYENVSQDELDAITDGKVHYHVMKEDDIEVGDLLMFNLVSNLNGIVTPTQEVFKATHKLTSTGCPRIHKGYAIVTLKRMVESKK